KKMSTIKKAKLQTDSGRSFQEGWTETFGMVDSKGKALCVICNESVVYRTSSVKRHFDTNHKNITDLNESERKEFLQRAMRSAGSLFHDFPNKDKIVQRITDMPLSRNTVKDRILRMAEDVSQQLTAELQKSEFYSLCLDESTDVSNHARLAVIMRYAAGENMREELVKLLPLSGRTTGNDIFNAVRGAFLAENISLEKVVSVTTDGAPSMVGATSGFIQYLVQEAKHPVVQFHCLIHQEALSARDSSNKLHDILKIVTKIVNYIMARALNFRQFQMLLDEVQSQYSTLLMYNNVRWLSRGRVLERFVACLDEIRLFMDEKGKNCPQLTDIVWLNTLMFFTDFTKHFNDVNQKLQGFGKTAESMFGDIRAFERKLEVFERDIDCGQLKYFPNLKTHLQKSAHFADSPTMFDQLNISQLEWLGLENGEKAESAENEILKVWNSLPNSFKAMKTLGISLLTFFGSSYFCEQLFSGMNLIKSDMRNRLTDDMSDACVALKMTDGLKKCQWIFSSRSPISHRNVNIVPSHLLSTQQRGEGG
ncbi:GTD2B protein, partial [Polyodon spathula]|nr:GTD2B protein [Polyodon spathula]